MPLSRFMGVAGFAVLRSAVGGLAVIVLIIVMVGVRWLRGLREVRGFGSDDLALHALALAAAPRIAVAGPAAGGAVFALFLRLAMGALVGFDQRLSVGDRD